MQVTSGWSIFVKTLPVQIVLLIIWLTIHMPLSVYATHLTYVVNLVLIPYFFAVFFTQIQAQHRGEYSIGSFWRVNLEKLRHTILAYYIYILSMTFSSAVLILLYMTNLFHGHLPLAVFATLFIVSQCIRLYFTVAFLEHPIHIFWGDHHYLSALKNSMTDAHEYRWTRPKVLFTFGFVFWFLVAAVMIANDISFSMFADINQLLNTPKPLMISAINLLLQFSFISAILYLYSIMIYRKGLLTENAD